VEEIEGYGELSFRNLTEQQRIPRACRTAWKPSAPWKSLRDYRDIKDARDN